MSCSFKMFRKKNQKRYMQLLDSEWRKQNDTIQSAAFVHSLTLMKRGNKS